MKNISLAIPFKLNHELNSVVQEFNIRFDKNKNSLEKLIDFVQEYPDKRINISFPAGVHVQTLSTLNKIHDNIFVRLTENDLQCISELKEKECRFFFDVSLSVTNYTNLDAYIKIGVSDIYIADDLCYQLKDVSRYCHSHNVKIRLVLNRIPATSFDKGINYCSPIYRPQDIDLLNLYFDTFEFECGDPYDWAKFDVLYRAWFERKNWNGELSEINDDLEMLFPNNSIVPDFTNYKINCGRRCCQRITSPCRKCQQFIEIAMALKENSIHIKKEKDDTNSITI